MAEKKGITPQGKKERGTFAQRLTAGRNRLHLIREKSAAVIGYTDGFISLMEACKTRGGYKFFKNSRAVQS